MFSKIYCYDTFSNTEQLWEWSSLFENAQMFILWEALSFSVTMLEIVILKTNIKQPVKRIINACGICRIMKVCEVSLRLNTNWYLLHVRDFLPNREEEMRL